MLHLSFCNFADRSTSDYLFTDAPGEWFQKWALNTDSPEGAGARWIANRADVFLLIADREALAGKAMGSARNSLQLLASRLGSERRGRPVALVWTKADVDIAPDMETAVRQAVISSIPDFREFLISVVSEKQKDAKGINMGFTDLLRWTIDVRRSTVVLPEPDASGDDPLFLYGIKR